MKTMRFTLVVASLALTLAAPAFSAPEDDSPVNQCSLHEGLTPERLLRRLSIDLRGRVPAYEDYASVEGKGSVPESVIDEFLASDGFRKVMRRYHDLILWPNPETVPLLTQNFNLTVTSINGNGYYNIPSTGKRTVFRGGDGSHVCQDVPQDQLGWNPDGSPVCEPKGTDGSGPFCQEGYVEVHPYWEADPNATIRVCAFDAQHNATYERNGQDLPCNQRLAGNETECGCGPNMRYCFRFNLQQDVWSAWREQFLLLVDDYSDGSRPYSELLTTKRAYTNGRLDFYSRHLSAQTGYQRPYNQPGGGDIEPVADPNWHDQNWREVTRGGPHSGILSLPAFSLRFQTNRGRANRFRIAFTSQYFQPPATEFTGCDAEGDDLTKRCTCRKCHAVLEPLAAYFGQIAEAGSSSLGHLTREFKSQSECNSSDLESNGTYCNRFYKMVRDPVDPDIRTWKLAALEWAGDEHPEVQKNFDLGPTGIAEWARDNGLLARSTVLNMFKFLMKREMNLSPTAPDSELSLLEEMSTDFAAEDDLKKLVKRIVQLPQYRRMP